MRAWNSRRLFRNCREISKIVGLGPNFGGEFSCQFHEKKEEKFSGNFQILRDFRGVLVREGTGL